MQGILALTVNKLGMSLITMDKPTETVAFMDDFDFTVSLDSRTTDLDLMTSIEINAKPVIFRASYRDINFITDIVTRALAAFTSSQTYPTPSENITSTEQGVQSSFTGKASEKSKPGPVGKATVILAREQVSADPLKN